MGKTKYKTTAGGRWELRAVISGRVGRIHKILDENRYRYREKIQNTKAMYLGFCEDHLITHIYPDNRGDRVQKCTRMSWEP